MARRGGNGLGRALLRTVAYLVLGALAIVLFAVAFFPFERLEPWLAARLARETGAQVELGQLAAGWSQRGPYAELLGLSLRWADGSALAVDSMRVSPALSLGWLRGEPAARVTSAAAFGSFEGVASQLHLSGDLRGLDLAQLPGAWFGPGGAPVDGPLDGRVDLARVAEQWRGETSFSGAGGSLALPGLPVAIPYESLRGTLRLDEIGALAIDGLEVRGPLVSGAAHGTIAAGYAGPATGAVDVTIDIERSDPALAPVLAQYGLALDANGAGRIHVGGTPDQVQVRLQP